MKKNLKFQLSTYDVYGSEYYGWTVNDAYRQNVVEIPCEESVCNVGTAFEFSVWCPSDEQIAKAFGMVKEEIIIDAPDNTTFYVDYEVDGCPLGELVLIEEDEEE